jgi:hypothetical protein
VTGDKIDAGAFRVTCHSPLATRTSACLRHPEILFRRNSFASASSVSLFPRERMRDITSDRFRLGENVRHFLTTD